MCPWKEDKWILEIADRRNQVGMFLMKRVFKAMRIDDSLDDGHVVSG